jgi:hypothetical protein
MDTLMGYKEEERLPTLYLDEAQLKKLGDVGDVGGTREIHCTVRVASVSDGQDGIVGHAGDRGDGVHGGRRQARRR